MRLTIQLASFIPIEKGRAGPYNGTPNQRGDSAEQQDVARALHDSLNAICLKFGDPLHRLWRTVREVQSTADRSPSWEVLLPALSAPGSERVAPEQFQLPAA